MKDSAKHWRISTWGIQGKWIKYLRPLAAGAWEAVGDLDHLGVRRPIKGIKNCAERQSSLLVWNSSTQVGAQALSLFQRLTWEEEVCRTNTRRWKSTQWVHNWRPFVLTPHQTLCRPKVLVRSGMFHAAWIWRKQSSDLSNGIPSTIFLPFLSRLQVVPFGGFPCSIQRCTRLLCLYFSYTTKTTWNLNCPSLLGLTQTGRAAVKNKTISRVLQHAI